MRIFCSGSASARLSTNLRVSFQKRCWSPSSVPTRQTLVMSVQHEAPHLRSLSTYSLIYVTCSVDDLLIFLKLQVTKDFKKNLCSPAKTAPLLESQNSGKSTSTWIQRGLYLSPPEAVLNVFADQMTLEVGSTKTLTNWWERAGITTGFVQWAGYTPLTSLSDADFAWEYPLYIS